MKHNKLISLCFFLLSMLALCAIALPGCGGETEYKPNIGGAAEPVILEPSDPEVLKKWDSSELLNKLPRYTGGGYYSDVIQTEDGGVNIYYFNTEASDFEFYCSSLKTSGFKLKEGSSIWASEGAAGAPEFFKGNLKVTVVWLNDGMLAISCKIAG